MLGAVKSWSSPLVPDLARACAAPTVYCTGAQGPVNKLVTGDEATLYVCGITPYDATHLGHAATYVAFDILHRVWLDAGYSVNYVQNITDVDDPLLERAQATGVDWQELAAEQIDLFRTDMEALRIIPPRHYIGAVESMEIIGKAVRELLDAGAAYALDNGDIYFRINGAYKPPFGSVSHYDHATMLELFGERGGDPDTPGKEDQLDPLLWRAKRTGEPAWKVQGLPEGRPGWHIECTVIAQTYAGLPLHVQGGGNDLVFPHHEMGAAHAAAWAGEPLAHAYIHTGMVGYEGSKMSKSLGNLVLVSKLRERGVDPMAIRLTILDHHYRSDWMYEDAALAKAEERLDQWKRAAQVGNHMVAKEVVAELREALADDLDTPTAVSLIDDWAHNRDANASPAEAAAVVDAIDALLGVKLVDGGN